MVAKNDITGDSIRSKGLSQKGRDNWDNIFGKKKQEKPIHPAETRYPHLKEEDKDEK